MAMTKGEVFWAAQLRVFFSYVHKAILLLVAVGGFVALYQLGVRKHDFDEKERWKASDLPNLFVGNLGSVKDCVSKNIRKTGYATRSELIAATQEKAESCIWQSFQEETEEIQGKIRYIEEGSKLDDKQEFEKYGRLLDSLEKKENYTRSQVNAVRLQLNARLREEPSTSNDERSVFTSMLDEKSGAHILYEVLWYGSLLFGIAGSTLLLVVVLTAFPITNGEGYWTQRIGEILDRIPGTANRAVAVPLLAAAIGGGTLAGTAIETRPGGEARTYDQRTYITDGTGTDSGDVNLTSNFDFNGWTYRKGDRVFIDKRKPADPMTIKWEEVTGPMKENTDLLMEKTGEQSGEIVTAINKVNVEVSKVTKAAQDAYDLAQALDRRLQAIEATSGYMLGCLGDLQPVVKKVAAVETLVQDHADSSQDTARSVEYRERTQGELAEVSLAQTAEVDPRNAFARIFLWTVYKVGPAVPDIFRERLQGEPDRERFVEALKRMQGEEAVGSRKFEALLRYNLKEESIEDAGIEKLLDKHFRSLLRVCALARR